MTPILDMGHHTWFEGQALKKIEDYGKATKERFNRFGATPWCSYMSDGGDEWSTPKFRQYVEGRAPDLVDAIVSPPTEFERYTRTQGGADEN